MLQMSTESSPVAREQSSTKSSPCHPFAMRSLDLSLEQSSLKISESCESQSRTRTFSAAAAAAACSSKILSLSARTRTSCCLAK